MDSHPIERLMKSTLENLKAMVDVNTIVGEPIKSHDGTLIIPISKVTLGFASGGTEFLSNRSSREEDNKFPFGGGSSSGVSVKPIAFLVITEGNVRLIPVDQQNINIFDRIIDQIPSILNLFTKDSCKDKENPCKKEKREVEEE